MHTKKQISFIVFYYAGWHLGHSVFSDHNILLLDNDHHHWITNMRIYYFYNSKKMMYNLDIWNIIIDLNAAFNHHHHYQNFRFFLEQQQQQIGNCHCMHVISMMKIAIIEWMDGWKMKTNGKKDIEHTHTQHKSSNHSITKCIKWIKEKISLFLWSIWWWWWW